MTSVRSLGDFFTTTVEDRRADNMSDPRLLYDARSGRWFFVAFDVSRNETLLSVSSSSDPTQTWLTYTLTAAGCPDQPRIAASDTMVALSYDLFVSCATRIPPYIGGEVILLDKQALLAGQAPATSYFGPDARFTAITPVTPLDGGSTISMVSTDYLFSQVILYTATTVEQPSIPIQRVPVQLLTRSPPPAQAGSPVALDSGDNRVQDAFGIGGNVWLAANDGCTVIGSTVLQGCVRYLELGPAGQVLDQREEALANGRSDLYPAFRPDANGNLFSIYGYSSANDEPGLAATIDPGHASGYLELKAGESADESSRWGDYFSAARDPTDGSRVWVAGAYGVGGTWGTFIAALSTTAFSIPNPTPPPAPTGNGGSSSDSSADTTPPKVIALSSAGIAGAIVRLRYRLADASGRSREVVRIRHLGRAIGTVKTELSRIESGHVYFAPWHASSRAPRRLSFCVTAFDPSGNRSQPSCASVQLH